MRGATKKGSAGQRGQSKLGKREREREIERERERLEEMRGRGHQWRVVSA